jgi:ribonuclease R
MGNKKHHIRKKNQKKHSEKTKKFTGKIIITPAGFGFLVQEESEQDIFIPPKYTANALDGDIVEAEELKESRPKSRTASVRNRGPVAKITKILERNRKKLVGELLAGRKIRPLNRRLPELQVTGDIGDAKRGDWIETKIPDLSEQEKITNVTFVRSLGKANSIDSDINAVIEEFALEPRYTEKQNNEAAKLKPDETDRIDLTDLFCMTIDPEDAKDFDDAVSIKETDNDDEIELGVHIADVSAFITPGSVWDKEAAKRGFTAYIPCRTLPMLPPSLTKNASLTEGSPNPAHSVLIRVNRKTGEVISSKRMFSKVTIAKRLTFDEVQDVIEGRSPEHLSEKVISTIKKLHSLTTAMRSFRKKRENFLNLETVEIRVVCCEEKNEILKIKRKVQSESDMLIEECMLAANVAVAQELSNRQLPGLYRIHPEPTPEKLQDFTVFMEETFGISPGVLDSRAACNKFLDSLKNDHNKPVIIDAFLRSLMRALYSEKPALHFGLGKGLYSHFTSPIRRYPDLVVHQQLRAAAKGKPVYSQDQMKKIAQKTTEQEVNVDSAYYSANDRLKLHFIKQHMLNTDKSLMEGVIQKISSSGLLVNVAELGIIGFVPVEYLTGKYRKRSGKLVSTQSRHSYKCGNFIYLQLEKIDMIKGMAVFKPAN